MFKDKNDSKNVRDDVLFEAEQGDSPLDFSARGLDGRVVEFRAELTTSVQDVSRILRAWKAMEETVAGIDDPTRQTEEQMLLPARQLAYPYKNVGQDDITGNFDMGTVARMVTHVAGILMGAEQKGAGSTD